MKAGKLLASILVVSMALPMCACKPTSSKETDDPTGKTSEKKPTGTVTTDTEVVRWNGTFRDPVCPEYRF